MNTYNEYIWVYLSIYNTAKIVRELQFFSPVLEKRDTSTSLNLCQNKRIKQKSGNIIFLARGTVVSFAFKNMFTV